MAKSSRNICIDIELIQLIEKEELNVSEFVNNSLWNYFKEKQEKEESLEEQATSLKTEYESVLMKLEDKKKEIEDKIQKQKEREIYDFQIIERKKRLNALKYKWENHEITDDEYFKHFDTNGKFID